MPDNALLQLLFGRQQNGPAKTAVATPSPSVDMPAKIAQAIAIAKKERPDLAPVETYGPLSKMFMSDAQGYTSPGRTIYLNPAQMEGNDPQSIADTIIHEQTHVDQMKKRGTSVLGEMLHEAMPGERNYGQRPDEMEAFQTEKNRRYRMNRSQDAIPSFMDPGQFYVPMDQYLPRDKH